MTLILAVLLVVAVGAAWYFRSEGNDQAAAADKLQRWLASEVSAHAETKRGSDKAIGHYRDRFNETAAKLTDLRGRCHKYGLGDFVDTENGPEFRLFDEDVEPTEPVKVPAPYFIHPPIAESRQ